MFDYKMYFDKYCKDNRLHLKISFNMPSGYETANGMFNFETKTVFINAPYLSDVAEYKKAFYLFHELRHASQYLNPEQFSDEINHSIQYTIMYDGTCYKLVNGKYLECKLDGDEEYFTNLYLGQPYEMDANTFAYEEVKKIYGDSEELRKMYESCIPPQPIPRELYESTFAMIDEKLSNSGLSR
ncbi:MAG: hypothetical protein GX260_02140 [Tissierellia bacterium]|nr:hypothetical protein [Bacillota bacterium]NLL22567.1 hypothetical protein [Tissierellia bacterium]